MATTTQSPSAEASRHAAGNLREVAALATPVVLQQLSATAMGVVDSAMVGRLGPTPLAAPQGAAPQDGAPCHSGQADDTDVQRCEPWCDPVQQPSHCDWCKCAACPSHVVCAHGGELRER